MTYWKTITTFLLDGSPTGIKTVELSNWIWKSLIIPRAKLKDIKNRPEALQPAVYFLFWIDEEWRSSAYIWESENLISRIWTHDTNKPFWDTVIAFVSKDNNLTKADVKYLEAKCIEKAKKANRYTLKNWIEPIPNNLPEYQISTMNEFLDNIDILISSIWYPIIKEVDNKEELSLNNLYYCKWPDADAKWYYISEGFYVLKWSKSRISFAPATWEWVKILQNKLITDNILIIDNENPNSYLFTEDYLFKSPSSAAQLVLWRSANWWTEWKNNNNKSLDEAERKKINDNL